MEFTTADYKAAVNKVYAESRLVRWLCKRTPENEQCIEKIASVVWVQCIRLNATQNNELVRNNCRNAVVTEIGFAWLPILIQILLPIIIDLLIQFFLEKRAAEQ